MGTLSAAEICAQLFSTMIIVVVGTALAGGRLCADESTPAERVFSLKLHDIFAQKCMACHGDAPRDLGGGLDMRSREALLRGGESFESEVLIPSHGGESMLYRVVARTEDGFEMPPKESEALSAEEAKWVRDWIDAGAPWPDAQRIQQIRQQYAEGEQVLVSKALSDSWANRRYQPKDLWAYRSVQPRVAPSDHSLGDHSLGDANPIDGFLSEKQKSLGMDPAPPASASTLIRRITFGLTGLPPTPQQVQAFRVAHRADPNRAVKDLSGRLLNSPHYGEHFGRHWLDVVRYADSAGFANDYARPNAWRYRDYVIRAFNDDKSYNVFAKQQIAGDEIDDSDSENLVATGFLRMGPWEQTGMSVFKVTRQQWLDDVVDSVGQTFLAHPLQCAKCHDHKFDPIPTRDYYRMMAVFSTTQFAERDALWLPQENLDGHAEATKLISQKIQAYQNQKKELEDTIKRNRKSEDAEASTGDNGLSPGDEASLSRIKKNISRHQWELDQVKPIAFSVYTGKTILRNNVSSRLLLPADPWKKGELPDDTILNGGDAFSAGAPVVPGAISAAASLSGMPPSAIPDARGKRRLALANWITDPRNPLTARVMVNRVWAWHFGRGIAGNPNNFGATGGHPTHPELLDYLADWFVKNGGSVKRLNQLIVSSAAYQRSGEHPDPTILSEKDPSGETYAVFRPRRLTAEELRDTMLACSGELNPAVGGIPCKPDINWEVAVQPRQIMGGTASVYEPDPDPKSRNRRTVYTLRLRGLRDPFLQTFNQPGFDKSCEMRDSSTVAPQALTLFNAAEVHDRSLALAKRLIDLGGDDREILRRAFQIVLSRMPTESETEECLRRWNVAVDEESMKKPVTHSIDDTIERTVMAEKTGEPYDFVEVMPAYRTYFPDLGPHQVDVRTRGLSHVCLVLLNSNEFAHVD